jgi:AcrR family transcriptional regulator
MNHPGELADEAELAPHLPGPGRPPSTTRHQLQEIAIEMFSAHGYDEVTIEALAAAAGISRRTFFRYFNSKADALMADFDQDVERLRSALAGSDPGLPVLDAIQRAIVAVNSYHAEDLATAAAARQPGPAGERHPALRAVAGGRGRVRGEPSRPGARRSAASGHRALGVRCRLRRLHVLAHGRLR